MEFKAKFKRTAGAGLNLCGASVNFKISNPSLSLGVKFKISNPLRDGAGENFKSAGLNLRGGKEMKFKSALLRPNLLNFSARPALALSTRGKTRRGANGNSQTGFKILNPRCDMKFCAVSAKGTEARVNFKISNRLLSSGTNFKISNPLRNAGIKFKNSVAAVRKPKLLAPRNFKNFIARPFLR